MKRIVLFILCFMLLLSSVACGQDKPTVTESDTEGTSETVTDAESQTETEEESRHEEESTSADPNKMKHIATCDGIDFYRDEEELIYAHIDAWGDTMFSLGYYDEIGDALLGETCAEIVAYTRGERVSENSDKDYLTVTVLKLDRNREEIEAYSNDLYVIWEDPTVIFFNYYQEGCAYYFYLPELDPDLISSEPYGSNEHRLHRYGTTDGGKTWTDQTNDFLVYSACRQHPVLAKFVNKKVGILVFHYRGIITDARGRTLITVDCGKTWEHLPALPYPFDYEHGHSEVQDLEWIDNRYVLTIKYWTAEYDESTFVFTSEDMNNWILAEQ